MVGFKLARLSGMGMKINFAEVKESTEYSSAIIRFGFGILSSVFLGMAMKTGYYEPVWDFYIYFMLAFFLYATIIFVSVLFVPRVTYRPYITIVFDVAAISIAMLFTDFMPGATVTAVIVLMLTHVVAGLIAIYVLPAMTRAT